MYFRIKGLLVKKSFLSRRDEDPDDEDNGHLLLSQPRNGNLSSLSNAEIDSSMVKSLCGRYSTPIVFAFSAKIL